MKQIDLYLIGKHNIIQAVLGLYDSEVKDKQSLILDCGCGRGTYAHKFDGEQYVGLDVNVSSIKLAHFFHPKSMFVVGDATKIPFKDLTFDHVICSEVLEHIPNDKDVFTELARVTSFSGKLVTSVPNIECENVFVGWQRNLIDEGVGHFRRGYSSAEISKLIKDSGFKVRKSRYSCGPITAVIECCIVKLASIFGYSPSNLNRLFEKGKTLLTRVALRFYESLFPLLILFTYLDRLLPERYRSNTVIVAEKVASVQG